MTWERFGAGDQHPVRHGLAFLLCGAFAFGVDALILKVLTALFSVHPVAARLVAISFAMVGGWLAHRRFTFGLTTRPRLAEFLRYLAVGWTAAAINYAFFVLIVLAMPGIEPLVALFASSILAMGFSYLGMRFGAFRQPAGSE